MNLDILNNLYKDNDLNFNTALDVWKKEGLSPSKIREQVMYDVNVRISYDMAHSILKVASGCIELDNTVDSVIDEKLKTAKVLPYATEIKSRLTHIDDNVFKPKNASIDIEWVLVERTGSDGQKEMYLARRKIKNDIKEASTKVMIGSTNIDPVSGVTIQPQNCPAMLKGISDYQKTDSGEAACVFNDNKCKYLEPSSIDARNNERDLVCKIDVGMKE